MTALVFLLSWTLALAPSAQLARVFQFQPFTVAYTGTTAGRWSPTAAGAQLAFTTGGGSWTFTVNKRGTLTLFTAAAGGTGGSGSTAGNGQGGGGGAVNTGGITVSVVTGKTYSYNVGAFPGGNTAFSNATDVVTISSLNGGGNGGGPGGAGGAGGTVVTGAGTAGGTGGSGLGASVCANGGTTGAAVGGGGSGGGGNDGGTNGAGTGCGGTGAGGIAGAAAPDGYTGGSGGYGISATICGSNVGGGGGGGGGGSTVAGAGSHNIYVNSGQAGIVCLQFVSTP